MCYKAKTNLIFGSDMKFQFGSRKFEKSIEKYILSDFGILNFRVMCQLISGSVFPQAYFL